LPQVWSRCQGPIQLVQVRQDPPSIASINVRLKPGRGKRMILPPGQPILADISVAHEETVEPKGEA